MRFFHRIFIFPHYDKKHRIKEVKRVCAFWVIEDDVALNGILAKRLAEEGHSVDCLL